MNCVKIGKLVYFISVMSVVPFNPDRVQAEEITSLQRLVKQAFDQDRCAHSMAYLDKLRGDVDFDLYFSHRLSLEDQVRVANCIERVAQKSDYFTKLKVAPEVLADYSAYLAASGQLPLAAAYQLAALRVEQYLNNSDKGNPQATLRLAIERHADANLAYVALRLLEEDAANLVSQSPSTQSEKVVIGQHWQDHYQLKAAVYRINGQSRKAEQAYRDAIGWVNESETKAIAQLNYLSGQMAFNQANEIGASVVIRNDALKRAHYYLTQALMNQIPNSKAYQDTQLSLVKVLYRQGQVKEALTLMGSIKGSLLTIEAAESTSVSLGEAYVRTEKLLLKANLLRSIGDFAQAEQLYDQVIELRIKLTGRQKRPLQEAVDEKLKLMYRQGRFGEAEQLAEKFLNRGVVFSQTD